MHQPSLTHERGLVTKGVKNVCSGHTGCGETVITQGADNLRMDGSLGVEGCISHLR